MNRGEVIIPIRSPISWPLKEPLFPSRLFICHQHVDTVHAYVLSICFWRASLKKQNRKIHWHFESWIHRRCCLQCAENIRPKQPEQAWCQAISLGEKEEVWSSPFRIISNSAAAVWVWLCFSCWGRPALTLRPLGNVRAVFSTKASSLGHPRAKAKAVWRWKERWSFWRLTLREPSRKETTEFRTWMCPSGPF